LGEAFANWPTPVVVVPNLGGRGARAGFSPHPRSLRTRRRADRRDRDRREGGAAASVKKHAAALVLRRRSGCGPTSPVRNPVGKPGVRLAQRRRGAGHRGFTSRRTSSAFCEWWATVLGSGSVLAWSVGIHLRVWSGPSVHVGPPAYPLLCRFRPAMGNIVWSAPVFSSACSRHRLSTPVRPGARRSPHRFGPFVVPDPRQSAPRCRC